MKKKKSWIFITDWYPRETDPWNGIFIHQWLHFLQDEFDFTVLVWRAKQKENKLIVQMRSFGKEIIIETKSGIAWSWWYWLSIRKLLKQELPQHTPILLAPLPWSWVIKKFFLGKDKFLLMEHQSVYFPNYFQELSWWKKHLYQLGTQNASQIFTVSTALKKHILGISPGSTISVIPNSVQKVPKGTFLKKKRIAVLGDVRDRIKGISQALEWIQQSFPSFEIALVGNGPDLDSIKRQFSKVRYYNALPHQDLLDFIEESSVVIINSPFETFSILAQEVQQLGTFLMCRRNEGPEEFASNEVYWHHSFEDFKNNAIEIQRRIENNQFPIPFQNEQLTKEQVIKLWKEALK